MKRPVASMGALHVVSVLGGLLVATACFKGADDEALYACTNDQSCGGDGLICFDGVCCRPDAAPLCLGYVFPDGTCRDGSQPSTYFADLDNDGYGDSQGSRQYCAAPVAERYVLRGGDCNDNPEAGGALANPGRSGDPCDGVDNDCDGEFDEDVAQRQTYYFDLDGDGRGDAASSRVSCAASSGYVSSADDCAPNDPTKYPGAPEACNGVSDDCDADIDEEVPGLGGACSVPGGQGACAQGGLVCQGGTAVCAPPAPTQDLCGDDIDQDCNGTADDAPGCGGPSNLLDDPSVTWRAQRLATPDTTGTPPNCYKDRAGNQNETYSAGMWGAGGTNTTTHILTVETSGRPWDLTTPNTRLRLAFTYDQQVGPGTWQDYRQPVAMLCGSDPSQFNRYVHTDGTPSGGTLLTARSGSVTTRIPLLGSGGPDGSGTPGGAWIRAGGSSGDLTQVRRVEIAITVSGAGNHTLNVTLSDVGFEVAP